MIGAVLFGLAFLVIIFNNRIAEQRQLVVQAEKLETDLDSMQATEARLIEQIAYATSDAAVEEWAYQEARMIREGDQPIVPISPSESTPVEAPPPAPEPVVYTTWQIWWALFFDELPETH
jgi:cell division protein FtsB